MYQGLETERIFTALVEVGTQGAAPDATALANALPESDRRLWFEIVFEAAAESNWDEAESCLAVLRRRKAKAELDAVQKQIESQAVASGAAAGSALRELLARKQELRRRLEELGG